MFNKIGLKMILDSKNNSHSLPPLHRHNLLPLQTMPSLQHFHARTTNGAGMQPPEKKYSRAQRHNVNGSDSRTQRHNVNGSDRKQTKKTRSE